MPDRGATFIKNGIQTLQTGVFERDEKASLYLAKSAARQLLWQIAAGPFIERSSELWKVPQNVKFSTLAPGKLGSGRKVTL